MPNYPNGKSSVTPYVVAKGAERLLDFMAKAFGADIYLTVPNPDGSIGHAEARIGDSVVMVFDSNEDWPPHLRSSASTSRTSTPPPGFPSNRVHSSSQK